MKKLTSAVFGLCIAWLTLCESAHADYIYRYTFDQTNYVVRPDETFQVNVFLEETVTGGDVSRLATEGLFSAGVRVDFGGAPAQVLSSTDILPNTAEFDDQLFVFTDLVPGSHAEFTEAIDLLSPPVFGTEISTNVYRVFLGSFLFTANSNPGGGTIFALDIPETDDTITDTGFLLDPLISQATASITVVPEPSALTLLGIGVIGLISYNRSKATRWGSALLNDSARG